jgi:serine protease Do
MIPTLRADRACLARHPPAPAAIRLAVATCVVRALVALLVVLLAASAAAARPWAWLGVRIRDMSEQEMDEISKRHGIGEGFGVVVVEIVADAPAARAGLRAGDIVVAFEGRPVTETRLLQRLIAAAPTDRDIRLTVLRTEEGRRPLSVRLAPMPRPVAGERLAAERGFVLREPDAPAVLAPAVTLVLKGSAAEQAGLEVGDVILQVNDRAVVSRDAAREALGEAAPDRPLRLTVRRDGRHLGLTLAAPEERSRP